jgi:hypothetical protein
VGQLVASQPVHLLLVQCEPGVIEQFWQVTPAVPQARSVSLL